MTAQPTDAAATALTVLMWLCLFVGWITACAAAQDPSGGQPSTGTTEPAGEITDDSGFGEGG